MKLGKYALYEVKTNKFVGLLGRESDALFLVENLKDEEGLPKYYYHTEEDKTKGHLQ